VRFGHEGRDDRERSDPRRARAGRARRGPRVDVERTLPVAQGPQRLPHGSRRDVRPHVLRWAAEPVGQQAHGLLRGRDGCEDRLHARTTGCLRRRVRAARGARFERGRLQGGDRGRHGQDAQGW
jgi:hypothetical protein